MKFAVVVFPGSNCDHDAYYAARHVLGQEAEFVWHKDTSLRGADVVILPGGFAHGDYLRTGAIARFSPIMRRRPEGRRLRVCFVSGEYPPIGHGGIGRYTADLAGGLAAMGHDVHVVTISPDLYTTEYEYGVWVHRITVQDREIPGLERSVLKGNYLHLAALYHQVLRLHERLPMDVVSAPIWNCEGLLCSLDDRFATVTTLMTTLDTIRQLHPSWNDSPHVQRLVELEKVTLRESRHLHPISDASLEQVRAHVAAGVDATVMPVGERDRAGTVPRRRRADGSDACALRGTARAAQGRGSAPRGGAHPAGRAPRC